MTKETNVVYRYLGTTPKSSNLRALLRSLCQQLAHIAGETIIESSIIMVRKGGLGFFGFSSMLIVSVRS